MKHRPWKKKKKKTSWTTRATKNASWGKKKRHKFIQIKEKIQ